MAPSPPPARTRPCTVGTCLVWGAALAVSGCAGMPGYSDEGVWLPPQQGRGLVADPDSPVPDAPVPIGFVTLTSRSRGHVNDTGLRSVAHMYQGRADMSDTVSFYREKLQHHGWQRRHEETIDGITTIRCSKGPEQLVLRISQRRSVITVKLDIFDKNLPGPVPTAASQRPVQESFVLSRQSGRRTGGPYTFATIKTGQTIPNGR